MGGERTTELLLPESRTSNASELKDLRINQPTSPDQPANEATVQPTPKQTTKPPNGPVSKP